VALRKKEEKCNIRKRRQKVNRGSSDTCPVAVHLHQFVGSLYLLQPLIGPRVGDKKNRRQPARRLQYFEHSHQPLRIIDVRGTMNGCKKVRPTIQIRGSSIQWHFIKYSVAMNEIVDHRIANEVILVLLNSLAS